MSPPQSIRAWCAPPLTGSGRCYESVPVPQNATTATPPENWIPVRYCSRPCLVTARVTWLPEVLVNLPCWLYIAACLLGLGKCHGRRFPLVGRGVLGDIFSSRAPAEGVLLAALIGQAIHTAYHFFVLPPWWMDTLSCLSISMLHFATCVLLYPLVATTKYNRKTCLAFSFACVLLFFGLALGVQLAELKNPSPYQVVGIPLSLTWLSLFCLGTEGAQAHMRRPLVVYAVCLPIQVFLAVLAHRCDMLMGVWVGSWHIMPDAMIEVMIVLQIWLAREVEATLETGERNPPEMTLA